jgi:hypothetical protein
LAFRNFSSGFSESPQRRYQLASMIGRHPAEDVRNDGAPVLGHCFYELPTRLGESQDQVAAIGWVIASVYEASLDEFVAGTGGVGGVHAERLATELRFRGPRLAIITNTRSCGKVTWSSTFATDCALTATSTRVANSTASISARLGRACFGPGSRGSITPVSLPSRTPGTVH